MPKICRLVIIQSRRHCKLGQSIFKIWINQNNGVWHICNYLQLSDYFEINVLHNIMSFIILPFEEMLIRVPLKLFFILNHISAKGVIYFILMCSLKWHSMVKNRCCQNKNKHIFLDDLNTS